MIPEFLGIALSNHRARIGVEKYAVVADSEDAGQLVSNHHDRSAEAVSQFEDEIIEQSRTYRVEPGRRLIEEQDFGISAIARASPARFCIPPLIWFG